jgi:hypothetical protein
MSTEHPTSSSSLIGKGGNRGVDRRGPLVPWFLIAAFAAGVGAIQLGLAGRGLGSSFLGLLAALNLLLHVLTRSKNAQTRRSTDSWVPPRQHIVTAILIALLGAGGVVVLGAKALADFEGDRILSGMLLMIGAIMMLLFAGMGILSLILAIALRLGRLRAFGLWWFPPTARGSLESNEEDE